MWPGTAVFPDWFHSNTQEYWNSEFSNFFNAETGLDIDALWIDMNEPSNFCEYPCTNPGAAATSDTEGIVARDISRVSSHGIVKEQNGRRSASYPVGRDNDHENSRRQASASGNKKGLPNRNLLDPSYNINNAFRVLSNKTADTDIIHQNGLTEYDTHNL